MRSSNRRDRDRSTVLGESPSTTPPPIIAVSFIRGLVERESVLFSASFMLFFSVEKDDRERKVIASGFENLIFLLSQCKIEKLDYFAWNAICSFSLPSECA